MRLIVNLRAFILMKCLFINIGQKIFKFYLIGLLIKIKQIFLTPQNGRNVCANISKMLILKNAINTLITNYTTILKAHIALPAKCLMTAVKTSQQKIPLILMNI